MESTHQAPSGGPVRRQSPYAMVPVDEGLEVVLSHAATLPAVAVGLEAAVGLILAEDVVAPSPLPPFRASMMDGYAVRAEDLPGDYPVIAEMMAGMAPDAVRVEPRTVVRITTGAPVPTNADAVVKVEDTLLLPEKDAEGRQVVRFSQTITKGKAIRPIGCDLEKGQLVLRAGTLLQAAEIGLLATVGLHQVNVRRPPRVALLSTGDEVISVGESPRSPLGPGQIYDSNRPMLMAAIAQYSSNTWECIDLGIASDEPSLLEQKVQEGLNKADVLITSGGVSMGELDLLQPLLERLGNVHFGRVLMKPGKPLTFATVEVTDNDSSRTVLVFGLPGNPVSSMVTWQLFALPALRKLSGWEEPRLARVSAKLAMSLPLDPERPEYHRASLKWSEEEHCYVANSTGEQRSSRLLSMRSANALLCLPQREGVLPVGTFVPALLV